MTLDQLVTTLPTSLALQKAGVVIEKSYAVYLVNCGQVRLSTRNEILEGQRYGFVFGCSAYTAQELAEWASQMFVSEKTQNRMYALLNHFAFDSITKPDTWAKVILLLLEDKSITLSTTTETI